MPIDITPQDQVRAWLTGARMNILKREDKERAARVKEEIAKRNEDDAFFNQFMTSMGVNDAHLDADGNFIMKDGFLLTVYEVQGAQGSMIVLGHTELDFESFMAVERDSREALLRVNRDVFWERVVERIESLETLVARVRAVKAKPTIHEDLPYWTKDGIVALRKLADDVERFGLQQAPPIVAIVAMAAEHAWRAQKKEDGDE